MSGISALIPYVVPPPPVPEVPPLTAVCVPASTNVTWPQDGDVYVPITCYPSGGRGPYTYYWLYVSGDIINVVTVTQTQQVCQFYIYGNVTPLHSVNKCVVTDADNRTVEAFVTIDANKVSAGGGGGGGGYVPSQKLTVTVFPSPAIGFSNISTHTATATTTASANPAGAAVWAWTRISGATDHTPNAVNSPNITWTQPNENDNTAVWQVRCTDSFGDWGIANVSVQFIHNPGPPPLSVAVSPTSLSASRPGGGSATFTITATGASGGVEPYAYLWFDKSTFQILPANPPVGASVTFTKSVAAGATASGVIQFVFSDSNEKTVSIDIPWTVTG